MARAADTHALRRRRHNGAVSEVVDQAMAGVVVLPGASHDPHAAEGIR
jgi:hypothetical protein